MEVLENLIKYKYYIVGIICIILLIIIIVRTSNKELLTNTITNSEPYYGTDNLINGFTRFNDKTVIDDLAYLFISNTPSTLDKLVKSPEYKQLITLSQSRKNCNTDSFNDDITIEKSLEFVKNTIYIHIFHIFNNYFVLGSKILIKQFNNTNIPTISISRAAELIYFAINLIFAIILSITIYSPNIIDNYNIFLNKNYLPSVIISTIQPMTNIYNTKISNMDDLLKPLTTNPELLNNIKNILRRDHRNVNLGNLITPLTSLVSDVNYKSTECKQISFKDTKINEITDFVKKSEYVYETITFISSSLEKIIPLLNGSNTNLQSVNEINALTGCVRNLLHNPVKAYKKIPDQDISYKMMNNNIPEMLEVSPEKVRVRPEMRKVIPERDRLPSIPEF